MEMTQGIMEGTNSVNPKVSVHPQAAFTPWALYTRLGEVCSQDPEVVAFVPNRTDQRVNHGRETYNQIDCFLILRHFCLAPGYHHCTVLAGLHTSPASKPPLLSIDSTEMYSDPVLHPEWFYMSGSTAFTTSLLSRIALWCLKHTIQKFRSFFLLCPLHQLRTRSASQTGGWPSAWESGPG